MQAGEFQWANPAVAVWQAYEPAVKCDLSSTALRLGGRLILIDPIPLAGDALTELTRDARPALIILTNGNHERAAAAFRARWNIPIAAHQDALTELAIDPDQILE
ncbi:MAG: hypothetical protein ABI680_20605, partial [Chthoniobacteraceae bacterium]